jgi:hypothetical protein
VKTFIVAQSYSSLDRLMIRNYSMNEAIERYIGLNMSELGGITIIDEDNRPIAIVRYMRPEAREPFCDWITDPFYDPDLIDPLAGKPVSPSSNARHSTDEWWIDLHDVDMRQIPSFEVVFRTDTWAFRLHPRNDAAHSAVRSLISESGGIRDLTEIRYIAFIARLKRRSFRQSILPKLNTALPPKLEMWNADCMAGKQI